MTSYRYKRCVHCKRVYTWQSSGYNCNSQFNDAHHCPDCRTAIIYALKSVPVLFKSVWVETNEVDVNTLLEHRKNALKKAKEDNPNRMIGERVFATLYDMVDPYNINNNYNIEYQGKTYSVTTWSKTPEKNKVQILMEEDIQTGQREPWKDY